MKIVSFDFDNTLSREDVQQYALELIQRGFHVIVVTSRFDEIHKHRYKPNPTNEDLYLVTEKLGIQKNHIRFMNMVSKHEYLEHTGILFHLDDDLVELEAISYYNLRTAPICVKNEDWKEMCERVIEEK